MQTLKRPTPMLSTTKVFVLVDPRSNEVRWVGKAPDPHRRLLQLLQPHQLHTHDTRLNLWLKNLSTSGLQPKIRVLASVPERSAESTKRKWIKHYRDLLGDTLTNEVRK